MNERTSGLDRRDFLKIVATAGAGALFGARQVAGAEPASTTSAAAPQVPTRPFGKTGFTVSCLAMGGMFDIPGNQLVLRKAFDWGVTYWDTADCYEGGRSEPGIGKYFGNNPDARKRIFLVTKSDSRDPQGMTELLTRSLDRMKTDSIDLYFIHGVGRMDELTDDQKAWAERMKKEGKIRLFGFSTHKNMETLLDGAAKLGWIDGIMFAYNYRNMHSDAMKKAVDACEKAGIGLTAMKTQGGGPIKMDSEKERELAGRFIHRGFTPEQAKLKAVWENEQIASICSQMPNLGIMSANVAAALDRTRLTANEFQALDQYAAATCDGYCAGCANLCEAATGGAPVSDALRCLMYHHHYNNPEQARTEFARIPASARERLLAFDGAAAERVCPRHLPIARLVREATELLA